MSNLSAEMIKRLRDRTGVGMSKCKEALVETNGDIEKAVSYLRKKGMASAAKKEGREAKEGLVAVEQTGQVIALLEVSAETDFVVKNERFQQFAKDVVSQAAQEKPPSVEELSNKVLEKDKSLTIDEYRNLVIQSLGENIQLKRVKIIEKNEACSYGIYSHMGGKIVVVVEIEGASGEEKIAKDIAMHVAAEDPDYLTPEDVPEEIKKREDEIARSQIQNKPESIAEKIIAGKFKAFCDQTCLLCQKFVKDPSVTTKSYVDAHGQKIGKKLAIRRFWRWTVS